MTRFGCTPSSEEHGPHDLVRRAAAGQEIGVDLCTISDHHHPWVSAQGHSPFVWSVLGAIAAVTSALDVAVGVTCPLVRVHPGEAQTAATTSLPFGDRFALGAGPGEALEARARRRGEADRG